MGFQTIDNVKYYDAGEYVAVGDNSTTLANGISSQSYAGPITIQEKVNGKSVQYIGQCAFYECKSITKVTIYAKIVAIHYASFEYCNSITYINIPSTVNFIGNYALYFGSSTIDVTFEFEKGRTQKLFIGDQEFGGRTNVFVIYPYSYDVEYQASNPFREVSNPVICASTSFTFYSKPTTADSSKCPAPIFKEKSTRKGCTCKSNRREKCFVVSSLLIILFAPSFNDISTPTIKKTQ